MLLNKYFPSNSSPTENMPETIVFFVLKGLKTPSPFGDFSNVLTAVMLPKNHNADNLRKIILENLNLF